MDKAHGHLSVYLNDHLAGAVAALELLDTLSRQPDAPDLRLFAATLHDAIMDDRHTLETLMTRANIKPSGARRATAWLTERLAELKMRLDDSVSGPLRIFEILELIAIGIDGKRALWAALMAVNESVPQLRGTDFLRLAQRASEQREQVEVRRLQWARIAFGKPATVEASAGRRFRIS